MNDNELMLELCNKEITKLRREVYLSLVDSLEKVYSKKDVKNAFHYFCAMPFMTTLNRTSFNCLEECCLVANHNKNIDENE